MNLWFGTTGSSLLPGALADEGHEIAAAQVFHPVTPSELCDPEEVLLSPGAYGDDEPAVPGQLVEEGPGDGGSTCGNHYGVVGSLLGPSEDAPGYMGFDVGVSESLEDRPGGLSQFRYAFHGDDPIGQLGQYGRGCRPPAPSHRRATEAPASSGLR